MAMVRCPKHKIPYNDSNPRGCPACAREKEGGRASDMMVMQELARASQMIKRPSGASTVAPGDMDAPVTQQPRIPVRRFTLSMKWLQFLRQKQFIAGAAAITMILVVIIVVTSGAKFTQAYSPATYQMVIRPLPLSPNADVAIMFSAIGPQKPQPNPQSGELERYSYGTEFVIEAINAKVYAITFSVPNRSWRGLRVGMDRTNAEGALALLGTPIAEPTTRAAADTISGFIVYRSLDARPRDVLRTEVRPPNGCFDIEVSLQPRQTGTLRVGKRMYSVVGIAGGPPLDWVVTRVRAVSRAMTGPYAPEPQC